MYTYINKHSGRLRHLYVIYNCTYYCVASFALIMHTKHRSASSCLRRSKSACGRVKLYETKPAKTHQQIPRAWNLDDFNHISLEVVANNFENGGIPRFGWWFSPKALQNGETHKPTYLSFVRRWMDSRDFFYMMISTPCRAKCKTHFLLHSTTVC